MRPSNILLRALNAAAFFGAGMLMAKALFMGTTIKPAAPDDCNASCEVALGKLGHEMTALCATEMDKQHEAWKQINDKCVAQVAAMVGSPSQDFGFACDDALLACSQGCTEALHALADDMNADCYLELQKVTAEAAPVNCPDLVADLDALLDDNKSCYEQKIALEEQLGALQAANDPGGSCASTRTSSLEWQPTSLLLPPHLRFGEVTMPHLRLDFGSEALKALEQTSPSDTRSITFGLPPQDQPSSGYGPQP